jgi:hypothetical protein
LVSQLLSFVSPKSFPYHLALLLKFRSMVIDS